MPGYIYTNPDTGERKRLIMSVSEMLRRTKKWDGDAIEIDGVVWDRCISCEHEKVRSYSKGWPMVSESAGTHPDEVPKMMEEARRRGVNLNYTSDGAAIFENSAHRKRAMKALGLHDRQGYD